MDTKLFWQVIDTARDATSNLEDMYDSLLENLSTLSVGDIILWGKIFTEYHTVSYKNKLWAAAYIMNGGCSDDGFDYFRGWLISQGQDMYLNALRNPDSLAKIDSSKDEFEFEDMLSIASEAYFVKLKIEDRDYDRLDTDEEVFQLEDAIKKEIKTSIQYDKDIGTDDTNWDENEDLLKELLPALSEAFG